MGSCQLTKNWGKHGVVREINKNMFNARLETSRKEDIPAYCVFNNSEMEDLIEKYPITLEKMYEVKGFGKTKIEKYGEEILGIMIRG